MIVDGEASVLGTGETVTQPAAVCRVTVTLPVTATASAGIGATPATSNVRAMLALNVPVNGTPWSVPIPSRLLRTRFGSIGT